MIETVLPRRRKFFLGAVLAVTLVLAGCGFHLKGWKPLAPEISEVYLQVPGYDVIQSRLEESLRTQLKRRGARVVYSATAPGRLTVHTLEEKVRPLTIGSTGKAIEYEIETTVDVDYSLDGQLLMPRQKLSVLRDYNFDNTSVLASESERQRLQREMQEELANLILLRLDAALATRPQQPAESPADEPAG